MAKIPTRWRLVSLGVLAAGPSLSFLYLVGFEHTAFTHWVFEQLLIVDQCETLGTCEHVFIVFLPSYEVENSVDHFIFLGDDDFG